MANTARLVIDPITRKISTKYEKIRLAKNDNNSMRITFEMPRYVRGHDMSNCSTIEVHYDNISIDRKQKHSDVYVVTDIIVAPEDDETINFSWRVSRGATQIVGNVDFSLHFGCNEDPDLEYAWHTTTYSGIVVLESKHNTQSVVEKHPDLVASILDYVDKKVSEFDAVDIAQSLSGNEEYKAPSVAAVNDGLAGRVPNLTQTSGMWAYTSEPGDAGYRNTGRRLVTNPASYTIPLYRTNGALGTNTPTADDDAANKKYVDESLVDIQEDIDSLQSAMLGTVYDFETVESTSNPVTVPSGALAPASIDKIGCGLIADENRIINEAIIRENSLPNYVEVEDANACTFKIADGKYSSFDGNILCTPNGGYIGVEETYYFKAEVVSGSFTPSNADTKFCIVDGGNLITVGDPATKLSTGWSYGDVIPLSLMIQGSGSITCTDLILRVIWGRGVAKTGVPVTSVRHNGATVYTVPEEIQDLTVYTSVGSVMFVPVYGLAMSDTIYNYLDLANKEFVVKCIEIDGTLSEHIETIDVSAYVTDEDGEITVAKGDSILFVCEDGNTESTPVPNTITYLVKKGE